MKYYIVDVFTEEHFHGNPAGVCLLEEWIADEIMQKIVILFPVSLLLRGQRTAR
jgi:predicted PhzF superfamily epimerase YddE/YHI9